MRHAGLVDPGERGRAGTAMGRGAPGRKLCPSSPSPTDWIVSAYGASASGGAVTDMNVLLAWGGGGGRSAGWGGGPLSSAGGWGGCRSAGWVGRPHRSAGGGVAEEAEPASVGGRRVGDDRACLRRRAGP